MGQPPTHPELLDHLAFSFRQNGWDIQNMIRRLVHTKAYRRSSFRPISTRWPRIPTTTHCTACDCGDWNWAIRDTMLLLAGTLDERYGPSVAQHLTSAMTGRGRPGSFGSLDGAGRAPFTSKFAATSGPFQEVFDRPVPATTAGNAEKPVCLHKHSP